MARKSYDVYPTQGHDDDIRRRSDLLLKRIFAAAIGGSIATFLVGLGLTEL